MIYHVTYKEDGSPTRTLIVCGEHRNELITQHKKRHPSTSEASEDQTCEVCHPVQEQTNEPHATGPHVHGTQDGP